MTWREKWEGSYSYMCLLCFTNTFFPFIKFIGVTLINKITQVSGAKFNNSLSVYCIVCSPPQAKSLSITFISPIPFSIFPNSPLPCSRLTVVYVHEFFSLLCSIPPPFQPPKTPFPAVGLLSSYEFVSVLLVFISLYPW